MRYKRKRQLVCANYDQPGASGRLGRAMAMMHKSCSVANLLLALLVLATSPTLAYEERIDGPNPLTIRNSMRACPAGYVVSGVHVGNNQFLCLRMALPDFQLANEVADVGTAAGNQFPPDAATAARLNYSGPAQHWCGPRRFITGINISANAFMCAEWNATTIAGTRTDTALQVDQPPTVTVRAGMHACPPGYALMGAHFDDNIFVCGQVFDVSTTPATSQPPVAPALEPFSAAGDVILSEPNYHRCGRPRMRVYSGGGTRIDVQKGEEKAIRIVAGPLTGRPSNSENDNPRAAFFRKINWECIEPGDSASEEMFCPANPLLVAREANLVKITRGTDARGTGRRIWIDCVFRPTLPRPQTRP